MNIHFLRIGSFLFSFGILLGAIGTHILKNTISITEMSSFETGVKYLIYNSLGMMIIGLLKFDEKQIQIITIRKIFNAIFIGTLLFSFSIFFLSITSITKFPKIIFVPMTPIGGFILIVSWFYFCFKCKTLLKFND